MDMLPPPLHSIARGAAVKNVRQRRPSFFGLETTFVDTKRGPRRLPQGKELGDVIGEENDDAAI